VRFQFAPKLSEACVLSEFLRQSVPHSGSGSRKAFVAEAVMCPWNDTGSVTVRSQQMLSTVGDKLHVIRQVLSSPHCSMDGVCMAGSVSILVGRCRVE